MLEGGLNFLDEGGGVLKIKILRLGGGGGGGSKKVRYLVFIGSQFIPGVLWHPSAIKSDHVSGSTFSIINTIMEIGANYKMASTIKK